MDPHRYNHHSIFLRKDNSELISRLSCCVPLVISWLTSFTPISLPDISRSSIEELTEEDVGLLVPLGFDITAFTPAAYQRGSLPRPSEMSHLEDGFALRCFQRLS